MFTTIEVRPRDHAVPRALAGAAMVGAAVVHSTVIGEHYELWPLAGLFFLALEVAEIALAILIVYRWGRLAAVGAVLVNLGTVAVWSVSRTVGVPFGPAEFNHPEAVGTPDLWCAGLELATVALLLPWVAACRQLRTTSGRESGTGGDRGRR